MKLLLNGCNTAGSRLFFLLLLSSKSKSNWRVGRVVEGARLESVCTATYRGFESLTLRQK